LRQRFFNAFDDKTIIRLVVEEIQLTPRGGGNGSDRLARLSSTANTFSVAAIEEDARAAHTAADVVAVPEIDDQFDQTWRSDDAELGLEALAMLDKAADEELRRIPEHTAGDALARTRKRLALAWLNGQFEEIAPEHHRVDATRTLHEVAREVRQHVQSNVVRCSNRQRSLTRDQSASMIAARRWGDVGGTRGVATIFVAGALAGGAIGAVRKSWWD
jgi:hypothetical protein